jgi:predicted acetyltransferase
MTAQLALLTPSLQHLAEYEAALERGWSPDSVRKEAAAQEQLLRIAADAAAFVAAQDDPEAPGASILLPDGTLAPRLPGITRWLWDGAFCGSISLRWQRGAATLPPHVLGHIGFVVVPWKRRRGYATRALALILREARSRGLGHVELTADRDNVASQKVIKANGGVLVERFRKAKAYGGGEALRFRIEL